MKKSGTGVETFVPDFYVRMWKERVWYSGQRDIWVFELFR